MKILCTLVIIVWGLGSLFAVPVWADADGIVNSVADLESTGNTLWVANLQGNLQSVSVSASGQLSHSGYLDITNVQTLDLEAQLLLANTVQSWNIVDLSNPEAVNILYQSAPVPGFLTAQLCFPYVIVQELGNRLNLYDIATPAQPAIANSIALTHSIQSFCCSGNRIYASCADSLFYVIEIDPETSDLTIDSLMIPAPARDMCVRDQTIYMATTDQHLLLIDTTNPSQIHWEYFAATAHIPLLIEVKYDLLAVVNSGSLIDYYTISQNDPPVFQSNFMVWGASCITLLDDYTITGSGGYLHSIDHTDLSATEVDWTMQTAGSALDIIQTPDHYYLACGTAGIQIFSYTTDALPVLMHTISEINAAQIIVNDSLLYVADATAGLRIYNLSDITNPTQISQYSGSGGFWRIALNGDVIYGLRSSVGIKVIDVSDVFNPLLLGSYNLPGVQNIIISDHHAYLTSSGSGFYSFDITNPANPQLMDNYELQGFAGGLCIYGQTAYVSNGFGISIIDISDPSNLWQSGFLNPENIGFAMDNAPVISGSYILFWNNWADHLYVYDISSPFYPVHRRTYTWNRRSKDILWEQNNLLCANESLGFCRLDFDMQSADPDTPSPPSPLRAYPNPFSTQCTFFISATNKTPAKLQIYNIKGQLIRQLPVSGDSASQQIAWDGRDVHGKQCSNGIYLITLSTMSQRHTLKIAKLTNYSE